MPIPSDLYEKISHLVAQNRVNSAIELLEEQLPALKQNNSEQYHAALVLMQDFNDIQERKISGLLVAEAETNGFSFRLLEFSRMLGRKRYAPPPPPPPAASPDPFRVAQPVYAASPATPPKPKMPPQASNRKPSGPSIGKVLLYCLAGLVVLVIIGLLMEDDDGFDSDYGYLEPAVIQPAVGKDTYSGTSSTAPVTIANVGQILGNSRWYGNVLGNLAFDASGMAGSYHNGNSTLAILGDEGGNYWGTFADANFGGMVLSFSPDQQTMTMTSVDAAGNAIGELVLNRQ